MNENFKTPKIRFKGFTEDWEQRKLKDITSIITKGTTPLDKSGNGDINFIKIENINPSTGIIESTSKITEEEHNGYLRRSQLKENDLLFSIAGTLGRVSLINKEILPANTNQALAIIRLKECDLNYIKTFLKGKAISDFIKKNPTIGAQPNLSLEQVSNFEISYPEDTEAHKIGIMLDSLDNLITLHQRKYDKLVNIKKSMLEKMFPKNDSKIPEIRFKGFTEDWEQRKFDEMADYKKGPFGSALKKDIFVPKSKDTVKVYEQQNAINKNWKLERYFITKDYANQLKSFETHAGDIIISCAGTIGEIYELPSNSEAGIINQALMRVRVNEKIVSKDLYKIIFSNMIDDFSKEHSNGSAMKNIPPFSDLKPMIALIPNNNEQIRISIFMNEIDNLITLHQRKCLLII